MQKPRFERKVPSGDSLERLVCTDCGFVQYENPKIITGVVPMYGDQVLLCVRAIEPRVGFWTVPAGFFCPTPRHSLRRVLLREMAPPNPDEARNDW